jgi:hypothetical protein
MKKIIVALSLMLPIASQTQDKSPSVESVTTLGLVSGAATGALCGVVDALSGGNIFFTWLGTIILRDKVIEYSLERDAQNKGYTTTLLPQSKTIAHWAGALSAWAIYLLVVKRMNSGCFNRLTDIGPVIL